MKREPAWRVFAAEYNDATIEIKATEEKVPSYVVTPLGAKINRVYITGVLTDVETVTEGGDYLRAHISDPTGVFTIYSGQYQAEATAHLQRIEVPAFVAIVGKVRTYEPEPGTLYLSVRPEIVHEVNAEARDRWIIETCQQTKQRIQAVAEAMKMVQPNVYDLRRVGYSKDLADGVVTALKQYGSLDTTKYITLIRESLQYIAPNKEGFEEAKAQEAAEAKEQREPPAAPAASKKTKASKAQKQKQEAPKDAETIVFDIVKSLESGEGAPWDAIIDECKKQGLSETAVEEALTALMDKGFVFEPVLGTIKTT
jgi:uncharacterized protein